jgi:glucose/arabinose dehydrogenase
MLRSRPVRRRLALLGALAVLVPSALGGGPAGAGSLPGATSVPLDQLTVTSTQVAFGLQRPVALTAPDDGSGRLFIAEKRGTVRVYHPDSGLDDDVLLDLRDRVSTAGNERGLLGIATTSDFATSRTLYVSYTALPAGAVTLSRFVLSSADQSPIPPSAEEVILAQPHAEFGNHNGGDLAFGPDGLLYWSLGDGGGANDVLNTGQNLGTLLGKILRLDVSRGCDGRPYCVPADNPFVDVAGARPEIWAYGLRNAWKFSVDPADGSLWIGDVGQGAYEEVNHLRADQGGANLGWSCREGPQVFNADRCQAGVSYTDPVYHYRTSVDGCAIIGGHVYRGREFAEIATGTYLATDYCSGTAFVVRPPAVPGGTYEARALPELTIQPTAIGRDADGELWLINDLPGQLHKISFGVRQPAFGCAVDYQVEQQWGTGFIAKVTVTNTGTQAASGWTVDWTFPGDQTVTSWWNAVGSQQGATVTVRNAEWNATLDPGGTVEFNFLGAYRGANPAPTTFTVNGTRCT